MVTAGAVRLKISLDRSDVKAGIEELRGIKTPEIVLRPKVDFSQLHELNRVFDVKIAHAGLLQKRLNFKVHADTSELADLSRQLDAVKSSNITIGAKVVVDRSAYDSITSKTVEIRAKVRQEGGSGNGVTLVADQDLTNLTNAISKAVSGGVKAAGGGLGSILLSPFKLAGGLISNVFVGVTEGLGRDLSKDLTKGLSSGIKTELAPIIGSFELVGKKSGEALAAELARALSAEIPVIQKILGELVGRENILVEQGSIRASDSRQSQQKRATAVSQFSQEAASTDLTQLRKDVDRAFTLRPAAADRIRADLEQKIQFVEQRYFKADEVKAQIKNIEDALESRIESTNKQLARYADLIADEQLTGDSTARSELSQIAPERLRGRARSATLRDVSQSTGVPLADVETTAASVDRVRELQGASEAESQGLSTARDAAISQVTSARDRLGIIRKDAEGFFVKELDKLKVIDEKIVEAQRDVERRLVPFEGVDALGSATPAFSLGGQIAESRSRLGDLRSALPERSEALRKGQSEDVAKLKQVGALKDAAFESGDIDKVSSLTEIERKITQRAEKRKALLTQLKAQINAEEQTLKSLEAQKAVLPAKTAQKVAGVEELAEAEKQLTATAKQALGGGNEALARQLLEQKKAKVEQRLALQKDLGFRVPIAPKIDPISQISALKAEEEKLTQAAKTALTGGDEGLARQVLAQKAAVMQRRKALELKQSPVYSQIVQSVSSIAGQEIPEGRTPDIVSDPSLTGSNLGRYSAQSNQIRVQPQIADLIQSSDVQSLSEEVVNVLVHELWHAFQVGFSPKLAGEIQQSGDTSKIAAKLPTPPTADELRSRRDDFEGSLQRVPEQLRPIQRAQEIEAYVAGDRYAPKILEDLQRKDLTAKIQNFAGVGGARLGGDLAETKIAGKAVELKKLAADANFDIGPEFQEIKTRLLAARDEAYAIGDIAIEPDKLSIEELRNVLEGYKRVFSELTSVNSLIGELKADVEAAKSLSDDAFSTPELPEGFTRRQIDRAAGGPQVYPQVRDPFLPPLTALDRAKEIGGRVKGAVFNPNRNIDIDVDGLRDRAEAAGIALYKAGLITVKAFDATTKTFNQLAASPIGQSILGAASDTGQALGAAAKATYALASGVEAITLDLIPAGRTLKAGLKQTAVPALAFGAATQLLPGGQALAGAGVDFAQAALGPAGSAISGNLIGSANQALSALPQAFGLQASAIEAVTTLITSATQIITSGVAEVAVPILGGKLITGAIGKASPIGKEKAPAALPPAKEPFQLPFAPQAQKEAIEVEAIGAASRALPPARSSGGLAVSPKAGDLNKVRAEANAAAARAGEIAASAVNSARLVARTTDDIVSSAREIQLRVSKGYAALKDAIAGGNKGLAKALQQSIVKTADQAQKDLDGLLKEARSNDDSSAFDEIARTKGRVNRNLNNATRLDRKVDAIDVKSENVDEGGLARVGNAGSGNLLSRTIGQLSRLLPLTEKRLEAANKSFGKVLESIGQFSNADFGGNLPTLNVDPNRLKALGAEAYYDIAKNQIVVDESIAKILANGPEAIADYAQQLRPLIHEGRHAAQLKGGLASIEEAANGAGVAIADYSKLTAAQVKEVNKSVAAYSGPANIKDVRALEGDATAFEANTQAILSKTAQTAVRGDGIVAATEKLSREIEQQVEEKIAKLQKQIENEIDISKIDRPIAVKPVQPPVSAAPKLSKTQADRLGNLQREVNRGGVKDELSITPDNLPVESIRSAARFDSAASRIEANQDRRYNPDLKGADRAVNKARNELEDYFRAAQKGLSGLGANFEGFGEKLASGTGLVNSGLKFLVANIGDVAKGFIGFQLAASSFDFLKQFSKDAVDAAVQYDRLRTSLANSSGSAKAADRDLAFIDQQSSTFGTDLKTGREGFVQLRAATKGTGVQGKDTADLFSGVTQASTVLGLSADAQNRAFLALQQTASKGKLSAEELRGQLAEALPGAFGIAARAIGVTESELNKLLETGAITSDEFLPKFGRQLKAEFGGSAVEASNNLQSSLFRVDNAFLKLKESSGSAVAPAVKLGADVAAGALDLLNKSIGIVGPALALLVGKTLLELGKGLLGIPAVAKIAAEGLGSLKAGALSIGASLGPIVALSVAVFAAGKVFEGLKETFDIDPSVSAFKSGTAQIASDLDVLVGKVDKAGKAFGALGKKENKGLDLTFGLGETVGAGKFKTDDLVDLTRSQSLGDQVKGQALAFAGGPITQILAATGFKSSEFAAKREADANKEALGNVDRVSNTIDEDNSAKLRTDALKRAKDIDDRAAAIRTNLAKLRGRPGSETEVAKQQDELNRLGRERKDAIAPAEEQQQKLSGTLRELQARRKALEEAPPSKARAGALDEIDQKSERVRKQLEKLRNEEISIGVNVDPVRKLITTLTDLEDKLASIEEKANLTLNIKLAGNARESLAEFGGNQFASQDLAVKDAQAQADKAKAVFEQTQAEIDKAQKDLGTEDTTRALSQIGVGSTGRVISLDSSEEDIKTASRSATGQQKDLLERVDSFRKTRERLPLLDREAAQTELGAKQTTQASALARIDDGAEVRSQNDAKAAGARQIALNKEIVGNTIKSDEDLAIKRSALERQSIADRAATVSSRIALLDAERESGTISAEEYVKRRRALAGEEIQIATDASNAEVSIKKDANAKILKDLERASRDRNLKSKITNNDAQIQLTKDDLNPNISDEKLAVKSAQVGLDGTRSELANAKADLEGLNKAFAAGALNQEAYNDQAAQLKGTISDLGVKQAQGELAVRKAINAELLKEFERAKATRELNARIDNNEGRKALIGRQLSGGRKLESEDVAIGSARLDIKATDRQTANANADLADLNAQFAKGLIKVGEFEGKSKELKGTLSDLSLQKATNQLALLEAQNAKTLKSFERLKAEANAKLDASQFDRSFGARQAQFQTGQITGEGGAAEQAKIEREGITERISLRTGEIAGIKRLVQQRVLTESEGRDRILGIEADIRSQRSALLDSEIQEYERQSQAKIDLINRVTEAQATAFDAEKTQLTNRSTLLEKQSSLLSAQAEQEKAVSDARINSLSGRESELGNKRQLAQRLKDDGTGENEKKEIKRQIGSDSELTILKNQQAVAREIEAEKVATLDRQQAFARAQLAQEQARLRIAQKIAEIEARSAQLRAVAASATAKVELARAERTGDKNQIGAAQGAVAAADLGVALASENVGLVKQSGKLQERELATRAQTLGIQQSGERGDLFRSNQAAENARRIDFAQTLDRTGESGSYGNFAVAGSFAPQGEVKVEPIAIADSIGQLATKVDGFDITGIETLLQKIMENTASKPPVTNNFHGGNDAIKQYTKFKNAEYASAVRNPD